MPAITWSQRSAKSTHCQRMISMRFPDDLRATPTRPGRRAPRAGRSAASGLHALDPPVHLQHLLVGQALAFPDHHLARLVLDRAVEGMQRAGDDALPDRI